MKLKLSLKKMIIPALFLAWLGYTIHFSWAVHTAYYGEPFANFAVTDNEQMRHAMKGQTPVYHDNYPYKLYAKYADGSMDVIVNEFYQLARVPNNKYQVVLEDRTQYLLVESRDYQYSVVQLSSEEVQAMNVKFFYPEPAIELNGGPSLMMLFVTVTFYYGMSAIFWGIVVLIFIVRRIAKRVANNKASTIVADPLD
jgi:hypothetical protein